MPVRPMAVSEVIGNALGILGGKTEMRALVESSNRPRCDGQRKGRPVSIRNESFGEARRQRKEARSRALRSPIVVFPLFFVIFLLIGVFRSPWGGFQDFLGRCVIASAFALLLTFPIALALFIYASLRKYLFCEACEHYLPTNSPWKCHRCKHVHSRTNLFSWLGSCEECGSEPAVFECPDCATLNLFTDEADVRHRASLYLPQQTVVVADGNDERRRELGRLEYEIKRVELQTTLVFAKRQLAEASSPQAEKTLSEREKLEKRYEAFRTPHLGLQTFVGEKAAEAKERCKDNPGDYERERLTLEKFMATELREIED